MERWLVGYKDEAPKANQGMQRRLLSEESLEQWLFNKGEKRELLSRPEETDPYKSVELAKQVTLLREFAPPAKGKFAALDYFCCVFTRIVLSLRGRICSPEFKIGESAGLEGGSPLPGAKSGRPGGRTRTP
eukprot:5565712-Pyramimonas_sp.AAC.1